VSVLSDQDIIHRVTFHKMIDPFVGFQVRKQGVKPLISYGLSSYGYDIRLSEEFMMPVAYTMALDPKYVNERQFMRFSLPIFVLNANSFVLSRSIEYFKIPRDILGICTGKSTYARCGVVVNVTPLEPEWEGHLTLEISNTGKNDVLVYANEGIAQLTFHTATSVCNVSYADKKGKYQGQQDITLAQA